jgi:Tim10/DDP family zinc finger.
MFWKGKDKKEEAVKTPTSLNSNSGTSSNPTNQGFIDVGEIENICYKKCIVNLNTPSLSPAEKNCLNRCANKFKESIVYGQNLLRNIDFKIKSTNNNIILNMPTNNQ